MSTLEGALPPAERWLAQANRFFDLPLTLRSRVFILIAVLLLLPTYVFPLYQMTLYSNQFPDGLILKIYSYTLEGGQTTQRDDLREINTLNHYIGMRPLLESDFSEFKWLPLGIGVFMLLGLRAIVVGKMSSLVDLLAVFLYFALFAAWSFYHRLYQYGHTLDPTAAMKVQPFMPPLVGSKQIANFTIYNLPGLGSYFMIAAVLLLLAAVWLSVRGEKVAR